MCVCVKEGGRNVHIGIDRFASNSLVLRSHNTNNDDDDVLSIIGPVRHFMELVVTGLSKNPHYSASEKRQCVEWYREYFNDFTSKELQSI